MTRMLALVLPLLWALATEATGQEWARKMFKTTSHDFGTVAKGSKQQYAFEFSNIYKEDIHVASVRSSCGCTSPSVTKDTLKTWETSEIVAVYNTKSHVGYKGATVTVTIDRPYYAEVQLTVSGHIRSDVVFTPGVVDFGSVEAGAGAETKIDVSYLGGRSSWQIADVRSANQFLEVELEEISRGGGRVNYTMLVRLKPGAPAGILQDQLAIVTDEPGAKSLSLPVEGQLVSPLSVSPASLFLGVLKPGETAKKRLVVRGTKPFHILSVTSDDPGFKFDAPGEQAKTLHFVALEYVAGTDAGKVNRTIKIETDLGDGLATECVATATIKDAP